jgi:shikimate kinase
MSLIFLIGMPGVGKTYWGERLSQEMDCAFDDFDNLIEAKEGLPVTQIFEKKGEPYFRQLEKEIITGIEDTAGEKIIACGGGTPCFDNNIQLLKEKGCVVYLNGSIRYLENNLKETAHVRPLLKYGEDIKTTLEQLYTKRHTIYEQAHITVNVENVTITNFIKQLEQCTNRQ